MAVANGYGKTVTLGSVFMYDTGDTINSYLGEPTTNVFKHYGTTGQGSAADNNVNFEVNGDGIFIRLGYGQTFGGYTIQPNDVVYKYNLGGYGCHYHGNDVFVPSGTYVTFTFDYYISPGAGGYPETNYLANMETGTGAGTGIASPNNLTGVWQTISVTTGPTTSGGNLRPLLYPGACGGRLASSGYILFKNPQVEYKPHKTPFTQTSRSVSGSLLPLVGNSPINLSSVSFDSNAQIIYDGTDDHVDLGNLGTIGTTYSIECVFNSSNVVNYRNVFDMNYATYPGVTGNVGPRLEQYSDGTITVIWSGVTNNNSLAVNTPVTPISANTNYHMVFTQDGNNGSIYLNGAYKSQNSNTYGYIQTFGDVNLGRGFSLAGDRYFAGSLPVFKTYNCALSSLEVQQNYNKYKTRFNLP
jgi:hypothetical protein